MEIHIATFCMDHYNEVLELWRQCEGIGLSAADAPESIRTYLERNPGMSFVAIQQGCVIGAVLSGHDGRRGYIHHLAVHPAKRRHGLGRRLVARCLSELANAGIQKCHLFTYHDNRAGIDFWNRIGWTYRQDIGIVSKDIVPLENC